MISKIHKFDKLEKIVLDLRSKTKKIVHCHGVFDLLHIGHIKYFEEAKSYGDILIVSLTPDKFVNKGPGRPAFNEDYRAQAIASLEVVDFVVINMWDTAIKTIKLLKPDFYVKGSDYNNLEDDLTGNIILEKEAVEQISGKIKFTKSEQFSSSKLINQYVNSDEKQKLFVNELKTQFSYKKIEDYINSFNDLNVLVIGEAIIDEYIFCDSVGKSGKEPVMVSRKISSKSYAGGAISVANSISSFCNSVKIITYLGEDKKFKNFIKSKLSKNIEMNYLAKKNSPTILKTRYIDQYSKTKIQGIYDLNDENINDEQEIELINMLNDKLDGIDLVISVDYGHGLITSKIVNYLINKSKFLAVNTQLNSFNSSFHSISKYPKSDYVCIHSGELRHDFRSRYDNEKKLMSDLFSKMKLNQLTVTKGKEGSLALANGALVKAPAFANKIVDRVGAGDSLFAITSLCVKKSVPGLISLFLGNLYAAASVENMGTENYSSKVNLLKSVKAMMS